MFEIELVNQIVPVHGHRQSSLRLFENIGKAVEQVPRPPTNP